MVAEEVKSMWMPLGVWTTARGLDAKLMKEIFRGGLASEARRTWFRDGVEGREESVSGSKDWCTVSDFFRRFKLG